MTGEHARLLREGSIKTASTLLVAVLGLFSSIVLARGLSESGLGLFVLVLALVHVGVMLADGGSSLALTRFVAAAGQRDEQRRLTWLGYRVRLTITTVALLALLAIQPLVRRHLFHDSLTGDAYLLALLWISGKSLFLVGPAVMRGLRQWGREGLLLVLEALGLVAVYSTLLIGHREEAVSGGGLAGRLAVLYGILALFSCWSLRWGLTGAAPARLGVTVPADIGIRRLLAFGLPLMMNSSLFLALTWTDRILLGIFRSHEELAYYFVAVGLTTAGRMLFAIPEQVFYSHLAERYRRDSPDLAKIHHAIFGLFASLSLLTLIAGGGAGRLLIPVLYGASYSSSVWPFQLLLLVLLVRVVSIPASLFLVVVYERTPETRNALVVAFIANLVLNVILIPRIGIPGAIMASLFGFTLATAYLWRALWRVAGLRAESRQVWYLVGATLSWLLSVILVQREIIPDWPFWVLQLLLAAGALVATRRQWRAFVTFPLRGA